MKWIETLLLQPSALQTVVVVSMICAAGLALGKVRIKGISLGIAFVFFMGIVAGSIGLSVNSDMLNYCETFGLVLFVYTLGLHVGPNFFGSLRKEGMPFNAWGLAVVLAGTLLTVVLTAVFSEPITDMVGVMCGATTNTPALGAAQQVMKDSDTLANRAALATAVTYPMGVLGVIIVIALLRRFCVSDDDLQLRHSGTDDSTFVGQYIVTNPAIEGKSVAMLAQSVRERFIVSRIWRGKQVVVPHADTQLRLKDNVLVVTNKNDAAAMEMLFGEKKKVDWNRSHIDWNHIDSKVESHVIVLSRTRLNGKRLGELHLREAYGVNVSRVLRGDVKLLATDDLRLQYGDRLTVVGMPKDLEHAEAFLGNSVQTLNEPNLGSIFLNRRHTCRSTRAAPPFHLLHHTQRVAHAAKARSGPLSGVPRTRCRRRFPVHGDAPRGSAVGGNRSRHNHRAAAVARLGSTENPQDGLRNNLRHTLRSHGQPHGTELCHRHHTRRHTQHSLRHRLSGGSLPAGGHCADAGHGLYVTCTDSFIRTITHQKICKQ